MVLKFGNIIEAQNEVFLNFAMFNFGNTFSICTSDVRVLNWRFLSKPPNSQI